MAKFNPSIVPQSEKPLPRANHASLPLIDIYPDPQNDHIYDQDDNLDLALVESVKEHGVLQPILLRVHPTLPGKFMIVAGHRRYRAAKVVGLKELPVLVMHASGEIQDEILSKIQFVETNSLSRNPTVQENLAMIIELEKAYKRLRSVDESIRGIPTRELIAKSMGMSDRQIADYLVIRNGLSKKDQKEWDAGLLSMAGALRRVRAEQKSNRGKVLSEETIATEEGNENTTHLVLGNESARQEFLSRWTEWKICCRVPKLNLIVREAILPDESRILSFDFGELNLDSKNSDHVQRLEHKQLVLKNDSVKFTETPIAQLLSHLEDVVPEK